MTATEPTTDGEDAAPIIGATSETLSPLESMERRLSDAFDGDDEGGDSGDAGDGIDYGNLTYRDGKKLEQELKADRERWRPFSDTFGSMNENDAAVILRTVQKMQTDPAGAAADFATIAQVLGWTPEQTAAVTEAAADSVGDDDEDRPLTVAEYRAMEAERSRAAETEREVGRMRAEIAELGYDLDAAEGSAQQARTAALISLATSLDGDIAKAHQQMQLIEQQANDQYIAGKRADAARPGTVGNQGTGPSSERRVETTADAEAAMNARLDAAFGPERRR